MDVSAPVAGGERRIRLSNYVVGWLILAVVFSIGVSWLWIAGVPVDMASTVVVLKPVALFLVVAKLARTLEKACVKSQPLRRFAIVSEDFFYSAAQAMAVGIVSGLLMYLAARAGAQFSMRDDSLAYADSLLHFDWDSVARWVAGRPILSAVLQQTYTTSLLQGAAVMLLGSVLRPGERNREFIWLLAVGAGLTAAVFTFVPAIGKVGFWDTDFIDRLLEIRSGTSSMTYHRTSSLVSFPSFHTVTAILVTYAARHRRWSLIFALLLNALMLAAIPPIGGHYLVDVLAGAAVAAIAIIGVRTCLGHGNAMGAMPQADRAHCLGMASIEAFVTRAGPATGRYIGVKPGMQLSH